MKFALNPERQRVEPFPKGRGSCPLCATTVIAKCGTHRDHHWAHKGLANCDSWKEKETQWHRDWKNKFPVAWQEFVQHDDAGEKHIADVRTDQGLVIEFQHSHLDPQEREARERFHKKIVWVVDGTRLKRDYPRFKKGLKTLKRTNRQGLYFAPAPEETFPTLWLKSPVAVFFDFQGTEPADPLDPWRSPLWQLLPGRREDGDAVVVAMTREYFVQAATAPPQPSPPPQPMPMPPLYRPTINLAALRQADPRLFRALTQPQRRRTFRRF